jgi:O-acetyl-ADP-ribose deacetylase (regulator of RNase III)
MAEETRIGDTSLSLHVGDITTLDVDAFVYYARSDLSLGSGFGTAISVRGGPSVQKELSQYGTIPTTQAVITGGGNLKARHIIHSVGPKFQEEDLEKHLRETMLNVLKLADDRGLREIAFPLMGAGFYGVPPDTSARVMLEALHEYLQGKTEIKKVIVSVVDSRQAKAFKAGMTVPVHP